MMTFNRAGYSYQSVLVKPVTLGCLGKIVKKIKILGFILYLLNSLGAKSWRCTLTHIIANWYPIRYCLLKTMSDKSVFATKTAMPVKMNTKTK